MSSASGSPPERPAGAAYFLALDASSPRSALALGRVDRRSGADELCVSFEEIDGANQTSTWLIDKITEMTEEAGVKIADLAGIACGRGPGTFTGTRIAVATAQGLALGAGAPIFPISTLAALAGEGAAGERILALLDARRGEVYAAPFALRAGDPGEPTLVLTREGDDQAAPLAALLDQLEHAPDALLGPGAAAYLDAIPEALRGRARPTPGVSARGLWRATVAAIVGGEAIHPRALDARYLRGSYAELGLNTPKRPMIRSPFVD